MDLIEAKRERQRQRARLELTGKEVAKINSKEQGRA